MFICASAGAPEADRVIDVGLTDGLSNRHPVFVRNSRVIQAVEETGLVTFAAAEDYLLRVIFDHNERGASRDFRPELQLTISW